MRARRAVALCLGALMPAFRVALSLTHLPVSLRDGLFASGKVALHVHPVEDGASWRRCANGSLQLSVGTSNVVPGGGQAPRRTAQDGEGLVQDLPGILWPLLEEEVASGGAWAGADLPVGGEK